MATPLPRLRYTRANRAERGIVLPVVLVMLLLMTVTVLFLMRRGAVDELLASNVRQVTTLDTAAQYALRTCERLLWASPPGIAPQAGAPNPPPTMMAPAANATAAWRGSANWANSALTLPVTDFGPGVVTAQCLIEDAGNELEIITDNVRGDANSLQLDGTWRKYRITAEVTGNDNTFGRAQAEVRMNVIGS
jgi:type IV pilus assembly protein PilX